MTLSLILAIASLLVLLTVWFGIVRLRRSRAAEARRAEAALAEARAGYPGAHGRPGDDAITLFDNSAFGDRLGSSPRALEVAEFDAGVDIDALLADVPDPAAQRRRDTPAQATQADPPMVRLERTASVPPLMPVRTAPSVAPSSPSMAASGQPQGIVAMQRVASGGDLVRMPQHAPPLREVALAWFEARGYRSAPASPAVRPIERVLRHRQDATRGYAFVVEVQPVSDRRIEQLQALALSVGLKRLLVVAEAGASGATSRRHRGLRLMDRDALAAELDRLDLGVAAKIIAIARQRGARAGP